MKSLTMVIHDSIPVNNLPETAEENGGVPENSSFSSPSTKTISGIYISLPKKSLRKAVSFFFGLTIYRIISIF